MKQINDDIFIEAIKNSRSPKLAYNAAKILYEGRQSFEYVGQNVIDPAWEDARRFGRAKQRKKGAHFRKDRITLSFQEVEIEIKKILKSKKPTKHLSRILVQLEQESLEKVYEKISHLFETKNPLEIH